MKIKYYIAKFLSKIQYPALEGCEIDKTAKVFEKSELKNVMLGKYSYIGKNCVVSNTRIGNFCSVGGRCNIGGGVHPLDMVSTSPVFLAEKSALKKKFSHIEYSKPGSVEIGNDVWIGTGVYIKAGIKIGNGAVIGAHAVVTKDVAPYSVVVGSPAKVIKKRFSDDIVEKLLKTEWWNLPDERIMELSEYFADPVQLLEYLNKSTDNN